MALQRHLKLLNTIPVDVEGVPVTIRVAGAATSFAHETTPDASTFFEALSSDLSEIVNRTKKEYNEVHLIDPVK